MVGDGRENKKRKQGGLRTMPFIFANEIFDRFAAAGFQANMISYLTLQLHMPLVEASNALTIFSGTSSLTSIIGALIADSFAGRFWTITVGSIIYLLGMICLTMSAVLPGFRPPPCEGNQTCQSAYQWQIWVLYISLICTSIGAGGFGPCIVAFGADQLEMESSRPKQKWSFFNLYYFSMGIPTLLALTVVVYIQDNVSWGWGLGIPTIVMAFSVMAFVIGSPLYIKVKPGGSPLIRMAQVVVAAIKKRKTIKLDDPSLLYENKELDALISTTGRLLHTNQLVFLDRAAIIIEGDESEPPGKPKLWSLSTVHRVEELKSIIRMLPIWFVGTLIVAAGSHNSTFALQQARSMDRHLSSSFQIPPASLLIFSVASMLIALVFYDRIFVPIARRFTGHPAGISFLQRMGIGLTIVTLASVAGALVEMKRKAVAAEHGLLDSPKAIVPISVFWMVPQNVISGVASAFMSVGFLEFLYDQSPESMRSTVTALFWLSLSFGSYIGTFMVILVQDFTKNNGNWLQDNINRGKLDYYYWLVTGVHLLNLVYFLVCFKFYTFKPLELIIPEDPSKVAIDEGDVELAGMDSTRDAPTAGGHEAGDKDQNV